MDWTTAFSIGHNESLRAMSEQNQRQHARHRLLADVRLVLQSPGTVANGRLRDMSKSGGFILTDAVAWPGEKVAFGLPLPSGQVGLAKGRVVRVEPRGVAIRFDALNPVFEAYLAQLHQDDDETTVAPQADGRRLVWFRA